MILIYSLPNQQLPAHGQICFICTLLIPFPHSLDDFEANPGIIYVLFVFQYGSLKQEFPTSGSQTDMWPV